jgi:hypothetical protein
VQSLGAAQEVTPTLNLDYTLDNAKLHFAYSPKDIKANFTVGQPEFGVGLDGTFDTKTQQLASYNFALWSSSAERQVVFKHTGTHANATLQNLSLSYFSDLSFAAKFGAAFKFDYPKSVGSVEFGGSYKQSDDLTLRAKINSAGQVGLAFTKSFNRHFDFTIGTQLDLNTANKSKFGFKVNLKNE